MRIITTFLLLVCISKYVNSQSINPGGVQDFVFWGVVEDDSNSLSFRINSLQGETTLPINRGGDNKLSLLFNFNPALDMGTLDTQLDFSLAEYDLSQMSLFIVFYPSDSIFERSVWFMEKDEKACLISTTHRTADLENEGFMNYLDHKNGLPVINTFLQYKQQDSIPHVHQKLVLGSKPVYPDLPIEGFEGLLAEVIVYNRVLSHEERLRIETYLAIKYGLSLSLNASDDWLNSKGEVIFKPLKRRSFSNRIFAIGRDDTSGLYQKQSKTSYEPELLSVGVEKVVIDNQTNSGLIENNVFHFFADDNGPLVLGEHETGKPHLVRRKWIATSSEANTGPDFQIQLNTRLTNARLQEGETWWLAIDRSGKGNFELSVTDYLPAGEFTASKMAIFSNIKWDTEQSGEDVFAFGIGASNPAEWDKGTPTLPGLNDDFLFIEMFPNPSPTGRFQVAIALKSVAGVSMLVTDVSGKRVLSKQLNGSEYYFENVHLNSHPGLYIVTVCSGNSLKSFPLVVE